MGSYVCHKLRIIRGTYGSSYRGIERDMYWDTNRGTDWGTIWEAHCRAIWSTDGKFHSGTNIVEVDTKLELGNERGMTTWHVVRCTTRGTKWYSLRHTTRYDIVPCYATVYGITGDTTLPYVRSTLVVRPFEGLHTASPYVSQSYGTAKSPNPRPYH